MDPSCFADLFSLFRNSRKESIDGKDVGNLINDSVTKVLLKGFCYETWICDDPQIVDDPSLKSYNLPERVSGLVTNSILFC